MSVYKHPENKELADLTEQELQQEMCRILFAQEKHLRYFLTVLTIYIVLTSIAASIWIGLFLQKTYG